MSTFKKIVREAETRIERSEHWEADIDGYEIYFECSPDDSGRLQIYQLLAGSSRMGIMTCRPQNVAALRRFAADAESLLNKIADELEANGQTDFRPRYERDYEEMMARYTAKPEPDEPVS